jgi:hypothetical protein
MSSHHIVRENQEPALLIANAHAISFEKVQELLEWMPTIIVLSTEVDTVLAWGIKIDIVISSLSEIDELRNRLTDQAPIKFISYNATDNPIDTAFYFLISAKHSGVNALLHHTEELERIPSVSRIDVEVFIDDTRWCFVKSGRFEKWYAAGTQLSFFPDNLKFDLFERAFSTYRVESDGLVCLQTIHPFWVGEELA